jgi:hypothetical protein
MRNFASMRFVEECNSEIEVEGLERGRGAWFQ